MSKKATKKSIDDKKKSIDDNLRQLVLIRQDHVLVN